MRTAHALKAAFTKIAVLRDFRAQRQKLLSVEHLAQMARAKADGANVHVVNQTIGSLRYWWHVAYRAKSPVARRVATANALDQELKLLSFLGTRHITL
jgi:hypothetical protein